MNLLLLTILALAPVRPSDSPTPSGASKAAVLTVVSLNLAHGRGEGEQPLGLPKAELESNLDKAGELLRREAANVVALQEADGPSAWSGSFDHVARVRARSGHAHVHQGFHFDQGVASLRVQYGTAILSDRELRQTSSKPFTANDLNAKGFVVAEIEFAGRPLVVVSAHMNSESAVIRRSQAEEMALELKRRALPAIVMGDLNSQWSNPSDGVRVLAESANLTAYEPEEPTLMTFPAPSPRRRLDWILISPELDFISFRVLPDHVSDHLAAVAQVRWR